MWKGCIFEYIIIYYSMMTVGNNNWKFFNLFFFYLLNYKYYKKNINKIISILIKILSINIYNI